MYVYIYTYMGDCACVRECVFVCVCIKPARAR